ncbi:hypothetical protein SAMN05444164_3838 [Bradyrhizobium erythrophlei]|uniref:Uncharacterized protein n=1 Tax=Bradyrhizobium erythrophlei TaxID=1437360 RepID=A0A1H4Y8N0_9BRAD|nr:hypothetical protein SAMN05444164_3838 [Bradyrhizobium erythrophlei]
MQLIEIHRRRHHSRAKPEPPVLIDLKEDGQSKSLLDQLMKLIFGNLLLL